MIHVVCEENKALNITVAYNTFLFCIMCFKYVNLKVQNANTLFKHPFVNSKSVRFEKSSRSLGYMLAINSLILPLNSKETVGLLCFHGYVATLRYLRCEFN